jgi:hypothetical protein
LLFALDIIEKAVEWCKPFDALSSDFLKGGRNEATSRAFSNGRLEKGKACAGD